MFFLYRESRRRRKIFQDLVSDMKEKLLKIVNSLYSDDFGEEKRVKRLITIHKKFKDFD